MTRYVWILLLVCVPIMTSAQTSEFSISVFGSQDLIAPSTPVITAATPVTTSQIDVEWSTSTDNFLVLGYVVFRDDVAIATTTQTSFSDTGLAASTTYVYRVFAFDTVPNYSTSSAAATTSTLAVPPPSSSTDTGGGTVARTVLDSISVQTGVATTAIQVEVRQPARIELRYGTTQSYELGYIVGNAFKKSHLISLNNLQSETTYYYEVIGYTTKGIQTIISSGSFTTLSELSPASPVNVLDFTAEVEDGVVALSWQLPTDMAPDALVRIVRSHLGFPTSISDGFVVYEGKNDSVRDRDAFATHDIAYYTAFVIDPNSSVSSGAIALARQDRATAVPGDLNNAPVGNGGKVDTENPSRPTELPPNPNMPRSTDIIIIQGDDRYSIASSSIALQADEPFMLEIPVGKIIGGFKTIVVTITDPRDGSRSFSFLLRLNSDRTAYTATIGAVHISGMSDLVVDIYDYDALVVGTYSTTVQFQSSEQVSSSTLEVLWWRLQGVLWSLLIAAPFITLLLLWFVFWRRRDKDEDKAAA